MITVECATAYNRRHGIMIITRSNYSTLHWKASIVEHSRPFLWVGLLCSVYGYIPHALYGVPILFYLGLAMTATTLVVRVFAGPLIAVLRAVEQLRAGSLPLLGLVRQLLLLVVLIAASLGGTVLLGHLLYQLAR